MHPLRYLLRGTGQRRAADYIPVVEAERDQARAEAAALRERLGHADSLLIELCCAHDRLKRVHAQAVQDRDLTAEAHQYLLADYDELAHRLIAANAELANLKPIHCPAPADWPDSEADTRELPVMPLSTALSPAA